jgi:hypothetical protein
MTLFANVLAVSLSGLLFDNTINNPVKTIFKKHFALKFQLLDELVNALTKAQGCTIESVYFSLSNQTEHTELPQWTDSKYYHLPFPVSAPPRTRVGPTGLQPNF